MTDTIATTADEVLEDLLVDEPTITPLPAGQEPDVAMYVRRNTIGLLFKTTDGNALIFIGPGTGRLGHAAYLTDEQREWVNANSSGVQSTWVNEGDMRRLGTHPEAHRFVTAGDDDWKWEQATALIQRERAAVRQRLIDGLRDQKREQDWCSELEDQWLPKMGIRRPEFRQSPDYRTFEIEVTMSVSGTATTTQTVTVEVNGEDADAVRARAEEAAVDRMRDDLRNEVDLGHSGYVMTSMSYETEDTDVESEFDSDEDGCEIDDDE